MSRAVPAGMSWPPRTAARCDEFESLHIPPKQQFTTTLVTYRSLRQMNEDHRSDIQCQLAHSPDSLQKLRPRFGPGPIASVPWNQTGGQYSTSFGLRRVSSSPTAELARGYAVVFTCGQSSADCRPEGCPLGSTYISPYADGGASSQRFSPRT